jgi:hypothetical protein
MLSETFFVAKNYGGINSMLNFQMQALISNVRAGTKRQEDAAAEIWEEIYRSPFIYGYSDLQNDTRSEFLLSLYPLIPKLLESYDSSRCLFMTYLASTVSLNAKSWRRKAAKENAARDTVTYCYRAEYDFDLLHMGAPESPYVNADEMEHVKLYKDFKTAKAKRNAEMIMILALKSALYLSDAQIRAVAEVSAYEEETIAGYVQCIKDKMQKKLLRRHKAIESRNQAFFLKAKYRLELERMQPDTLQFQSVKKQYDYQSRMLEGKNAAISEKYSLAPPCSFIAELLQMKPRHVTRLLAQAKKIDWRPFKEATGL